MDDKTLSLAYSLYTNPGVYAVLLGSGVSRAAGIPTGWEIVLDLCRKLAVASGEEPEPSPQEWYEGRFGQEPRYDELLAGIASTPTERNGILNAYFVPTPEEREQGLKQPTAAHRAIAELAADGKVRMILTTNFDRLMEGALDAAGVRYQLASTADQLAGLRPYVHADCTVIKLHGDYEDVRILNTPDELRGYPPELDAYLDRVFDEFGLIVAGWSAEWDEALRAAILRTPSRRYGWYWLARGKPADSARRVIEHRDASVITAEGADVFFPRLAERVAALERTGGTHPLSVEAAVATTKRLLSEERFAIRLHDLVSDETAAVIRAASEPTEIAIEDLLARRLSYTATLRNVLAVVAYHGATATQRVLLRTALERLAPVSRPQALRTGREEMPGLLCLYSAGVAAVAGGRYDNLRSILVEAEYLQASGRVRPVVGALHATDLSATLKLMAPDPSGRMSGSSWLAEALRADGTRLLLTAEEYDRAFDLFELIVAIVDLDKSGSSRVLPGRFLWREGAIGPLTRWIEQGCSAGERWPPLLHLFDGDSERLTGVLTRLDEAARSGGDWYFPSDDISLASLYTGASRRAYR